MGKEPEFGHEVEHYQLDLLTAWALELSSWRRGGLSPAMELPGERGNKQVWGTHKHRAVCLGVGVHPGE